MNRLPFLALLLPISFFLTGATLVAQVSESPASAYELGKTKGFEDGVKGLSRTPTRHKALYSQADRADFLKGYQDGYNAGIKPGAKLPKDHSHGQPLTAVNGLSTVVIMEGSRKVAVCHTASPNIEQTKFIKEQQQIVIKSRGNHGPATVELFDSSTGNQLASVKAYEIKDGTPDWESKSRRAGSTTGVNAYASAATRRGDSLQPGTNRLSFSPATQLGESRAGHRRGVSREPHIYLANS